MCSDRVPRPRTAGAVAHVCRFSIAHGYSLPASPRIALEGGLCHRAPMPRTAGAVAHVWCSLTTHGYGYAPWLRRDVESWVPNEGPCQEQKSTIRYINYAYAISVRPSVFSFANTWKTSGIRPCMCYDAKASNTEFQYYVYPSVHCALLLCYYPFYQYLYAYYARWIVFRIP